MPSLRATACAVVRLSPVSITTRMPSSRSACNAAGAVRLTGSAMAITPAAFPSIATKMAVAPSCRSSSAWPLSPAVEIFSSAKKAALPRTTRLRSTMPMAPLPLGASKPITRASSMLRSFAAATIAAASGCSLACSTLAAKRSTVASSKPSAGMTAVTFGLPSVSVPVLSTTSVSIVSMRSSASAFLISTPASAPRPTPTMIDIGVASPSAHGQAMISTVTAATSA